MPSDEPRLGECGGWVKGVGNLEDNLCFCQHEAYLLLMGHQINERRQTIYRQAPIIEAIVEFRYENPLEESALEKFSLALEKFYPDSEPQPHVDIHVNIDSREVLKKEEVGVIRSNPDQTQVVVIRPKSVTCSMRAPYKDFESFNSQIEDVWDISHKAVGFRKLVRVGMRYINRIDLLDEGGIINYEDFLNLRISLPEDFTPISSYDINFTFQIPDIKSRARIISTVKHDIVINHASFFLDIDIGRTYELPQKKADVSLILQDMRIQKNALFEQFITDKSRALFNAE